jgi:hypothetical protein
MRWFHWTVDSFMVSRETQCVVPSWCCNVGHRQTEEVHYGTGFVLSETGIGIDTKFCCCGCSLTNDRSTGPGAWPHLTCAHACLAHRLCQVRQQ